MRSATLLALLELDKANSSFLNFRLRHQLSNRLDDFSNGLVMGRELTSHTCSSSSSRLANSLLVVSSSRSCTKAPQQKCSSPQHVGC
jgi:hypothetical protein